MISAKMMETLLTKNYLMKINKKQKDLEKNTFSTQYLSNIDEFKKNILNKEIKPYQVEFQAPPRGKKFAG